MNEVKVITEGDVGLDHDLPEGWGANAEMAIVTGDVRYIQVNKAGNPYLGIKFLPDGSVELDGFSHNITATVPGTLIIRGG